MYIIYDADIENAAVKNSLKRILNQIYRLLPLREEGEDWEKPLATLLIELVGLLELFPDLKEGLKVICKLQGLLTLGNDLEFYEYRRTIFECCSIISSLEKQIP